MYLRNQPKVSVIDAICGAGKTSYAIQLMSNSNSENCCFGEHKKIKEDRFIYVTPFIEETERIKEQTAIEINTPKNRPTKYSDVKRMVSYGDNIAMTHELFSRLTLDILSEIEMQGYTLIMDEVANVLQQADISKREIEIMFESGMIDVDEDGKVEWIDENYDVKESKRFSDIKLLAEKNNLFIENNAVMFWTMDVESFTSFKDVYILTYLFDGQIQKYYYDMYNLQYEKKTVIYNGEEYRLLDYDKKEEPRKDIEKLLNIYEDNSKQTGRKSLLNSNFINKKNNDCVLSSSWLSKATQEEKEQLKRNLNNYFRHVSKTPNNKLFWTTKKLFANELITPKTKLNKNDDRDRDNFLPLNARATNKYADRYSVAYVYNRFMNPMEKSFFHTRGVKVNEDMLAQSDLIQFLFRGCIREGKEMNCYIPSSRMRQLLYDWLDYK